MSFRGKHRIVYKANTEAECREVAEQLAWWAHWSEPYQNSYEGGWAVNGVPDDGPTIAPDETSAPELLRALRKQAAQLGELTEQLATATRERDFAKDEAERHREYIKALTPREQHRVMLRRIGPWTERDDDLGEVTFDDPSRRPTPPTGWQLLYRSTSGTADVPLARGWVCRLDLDSHEVMTAPQRNAQDAVDIATMLAAYAAPPAAEGANDGDDHDGDPAPLRVEG